MKWSHINDKREYRADTPGYRGRVWNEPTNRRVWSVEINGVGGLRVVASGETATVTRSKVCAEAVINAMKRRQ